MTPLDDNYDHWARVEVGLDEIPSQWLNFNGLKNTNKNQINTKNKVIAKHTNITKNKLKWKMNRNPYYSFLLGLPPKKLLHF